ncbi:MAG: ribonuclease PH [Dehalococcoidia bacterium]
MNSQTPEETTPPGARIDGRSPTEARAVRITPGFLPNAEGSALIETGNTHVVCSATVGMGVPPWRRGSGQGWVTAEYGMLPRSSSERIPREGRRGGLSGRTQEIQRLIGRSLRAVVDMQALGEITITVDCDVLRADGGTRTAAITGGFVALYQAVSKLRSSGALQKDPIITPIAATSVGIVRDTPMLDLAYDEDSTAEVDLNVVMTGNIEFVEVQGTAEGLAFNRRQLDGLLDLAEQGIRDLLEAQRRIIGAIG